MKRMILITLMALIGLAGCASNGPVQERDRFAPDSFVQLHPGVTTQTEAISIFGLPATTMDMSGGMAMDMWSDGLRSTSMLFKDNRLDKVNMLINIDLSSSEMERLGLTTSPREDHITPAGLAWLHPNETTMKEAMQLLGNPSQHSMLPGERELATWQAGDKLLIIGFRSGVMVRVIAANNVQLSREEQRRLGIAENPPNR